MKIVDEAVMQEAMINEGIQFEAHERVPWFIVTADSVIENQAGEEVNVVETYHSKTVDDVTYAKMDSTHKNSDGTFSGAEPTYSADMSTARQKVWAESFELVTAKQMLVIERCYAMTAEEYRDYQRDLLEDEIESGHTEFTYDGIEFDISDSHRDEVTGQVILGAETIYIHDKYRKNDTGYDLATATAIMATMSSVATARKLPLDAKIKALYELADGFTKDDVDVIVNG